ncbi:MAG: helix-turn-helix transcriptional regulator [Chloroflexota bacterium]
MDAVRLGSVFRAVRVRRGLRQSDVAAAAGVSQALVSRIERGHLRDVQVDRLLRVATALEITLDWVPRWKGGELDRMLNAGHGALHTGVAELLRRHAWLSAAETTFSVYGERGSIDILAFHPPTGSLLVIELKTELVDVSGLLAAVDRYRRLAPELATRQGWQVQSVSCWVIFRDTATNRRRVAAHAGVLRSTFHADGNEMRSWLARPKGRVAGLSFVAIGTVGSSGVRRVRRASLSPMRPGTASGAADAGPSPT